MLILPIVKPLWHYHEIISYCLLIDANTYRTKKQKKTVLKDSLFHV